MEESTFSQFSVSYDLSSSCCSHPSPAYQCESPEGESSGLEIYSFLTDTNCLLSSDEDKEAPTDNGVDPELSRPLYDGAPFSVLDSYLLLLQYAVRISLTQKVFSELLQIVNAHLPSARIASSYKLNKLFSDVFSDMEGKTYFCCNACHEMLDTVSSRCSNNCESKATDFLILPIGPQLKCRMEDHTVWRAIQKFKTKEKVSGVLKDISDGQQYMKHRAFLLSGEANVTLICNTDGVSIYRSSKLSIWPIWLAINEFPPSMRLVYSAHYLNYICIDSFF